MPTPMLSMTIFLYFQMFDFFSASLVPEKRKVVVVVATMSAEMTPLAHPGPGQGDLSKLSDVRVKKQRK